MILVIGESGTGKSTSIKNLNSKETFIFQSIGKPLPFRGWRKKYSPYNKSNPSGNLFVSDSSSLIISILENIDKNRPEIKNIIIDDFQYIMSNEFMRRVKDKGYEKFNDIGHSAWSLINKLNSMRRDVNPIVLSHSEQLESGKTKLKTLGKMLDDKVVLEGMFTVVLQSMIFDSKHIFITQNNGNNTCKSPDGMFSGETIDNDLQTVLSDYIAYNDSDLEDVKNDLFDEISKAESEGELSLIWNKYSEFKKDKSIINLFSSKKLELLNNKLSKCVNIDELDLLFMTLDIKDQENKVISNLFTTRKKQLTEEVA